MTKCWRLANILMSSADEFAPTKVIFVRVNWNELGLGKARFLLLIFKVCRWCKGWRLHKSPECDLYNLIFLNWEIWPWQRLSQCLYHSVESKKECTQDLSCTDTDTDTDTTRTRTRGYGNFWKIRTRHGG